MAERHQEPGPAQQSSRGPDCGDEFRSTAGPPCPCKRGRWDPQRDDRATKPKVAASPAPNRDLNRPEASIRDTDHHQVSSCTKVNATSSARGLPGSSTVLQ